MGAVSFVQGVNTASAAAGSLTKTSGAAAWDAGAISAAAFDPRGATDVSGIAVRPAQNARNLMVGLELQRPASDAAVADYTTLDYALHLTSSGGLLVWRDGVLRGQVSGATYRKGDLIEVAVSRQLRVEYRINGQVRYTVPEALPAGPLSARIVIFDPSAGVTDAAWVDKASWCRGVSCAGQSTCVGAVCRFGRLAGREGGRRQSSASVGVV